MKLILFAILSFYAYRIVSQNQISITNVYDAFGKDHPELIQAFGFSCLIKYNSKNILFDAGSNADVFRNNIKALGIDLKSLDAIIVSHTHFDHINGIDYILTQNPKIKIYFPNDIFWGSPAPFDATGQEQNIKDSLPDELKYFKGENTKFVIQQTGRFWNANIEYVKESKEIMPGINLVVTTSPFMGYYNKYPNLSFVPGIFQNNAGVNSESGLTEISVSLKGSSGEIVVVGCSHSGIDKIIKETKSKLNQPIQLVYGGFHLLPYKREELGRLISFLKNDMGVKQVAPAHCSGHLAFKMFKDTFNSNFLFAGLGETIKID